nr:MAG TPA: hypothetical protein [Caudoviricetes sp.]
MSKHRRIDSLIKCCYHGDTQQFESIRSVSERPARFIKTLIIRQFQRLLILTMRI